MARADEYDSVWNDLGLERQKKLFESQRFRLDDAPGSTIVSKARQKNTGEIPCIRSKVPELMDRKTTLEPYERIANPCSLSTATGKI
jgi:hypothetical protein